MPHIDHAKILTTDTSIKKDLENALHEKKVERATILLDAHLKALELTISLEPELRDYILKMWTDPKYDSVLARLNKDIYNLETTLITRKLLSTSSGSISKEQVVKARAVSITRVVEFLIPGSNSRKNICCPFHNDKAPSLKVYEASNRYICFGCQTKGDSIDFVIRHQKCSFVEAIQFLVHL